jgi:hypothetical protein
MPTNNISYLQGEFSTISLDNVVKITLGYYYVWRESCFFPRACFSNTPSMNNKRVVTHKSMSLGCTRVMRCMSYKIYSTYRCNSWGLWLLLYLRWKSWEVVVFKTWLTIAKDTKKRMEGFTNHNCIFLLTKIKNEFSSMKLNVHN